MSSSGKWRTILYDPTPPPARYVDIFEIETPTGEIEIGPCEDAKGNLVVCLSNEVGDVAHWVSLTPKQANELAEAIMTIVATELQ